MTMKEKNIMNLTSRGTPGTGNTWGIMGNKAHSHDRVKSPIWFSLQFDSAGISYLGFITGKTTNLISNLKESLQIVICRYSLNFSP